MSFRNYQYFVTAFPVTCFTLWVRVAHGQCSLFPNTLPSQYFESAVDKNLSADALRDVLNKITKDTHKCLEYTSECVWDAIADLDESETDPDSIIAFYSRANIKKVNRDNGTSPDDFWNKEHIYPAGRWDRGERKCPYGDLHNLVAADKSVNRDRSNDDFDEGGEPVSGGNSNIICKDCKEIEGVLWEPGGKEQKGHLARMLFYMDVRYSDPEGTDPMQETNLSLVEGRSDKTKTGLSSEFGNLKTLLKWHCENAVTDYERERNDGVERWQGNRNPFIDYPDFVEQIFGPCPAVDPPPKRSCSDMKAGDIMITGYKSDNPDTVAFVATSDIPEGVTIYMTDNAWTGTSFLSNEGIVKLTTPPGGIPKGKIVTFGGDGQYDTPFISLWEKEGGTFALSTRGDNIMVYCLTDDDSSYRHLSALSFSSIDWIENTDGADFTTSDSALPSVLLEEGAFVTLGQVDNSYYNGSRSGTREEILTSISDATKWVESISPPVGVVLNEFDIGDPVPLTCNDMKAGDIMITGYNSDNPDTVVMVATSDIPGGVTIYMNDKTWDGTSFGSNEGTVKLTTLPGGIPRGEIITFGGGGNYDTPFTSLWGKEGGTFALSTRGEGIFVYCLLNEDDASSYSHLTGLTYASNVLVPSALPEGTLVKLSHLDNRYYDGPRNASPSELRDLIADAVRWKGSNSAAIPNEIVLQKFTLQ